MIDTIGRERDVALARAVLYRLAGHSFLHPTPGWHAEWRTLAEAAREAIRGCFEPEGLRPALGEAVESALAQRRELPEIVAEHARVFGHIPRAASTPYETEWTGAAGDLLQFHQLSDIAAFYNAFGLELGQGCDERPDHVSIELEFLHYLCVKEAYAREHGLDDLVEICRQTERSFLSDHLARWVPGLCVRLDAASRDGFYTRQARLLLSWIEEECRRLQVEPREPILEPAATSFRPEDACISCSQSAACPSELRGHAEPRV